MRSMNGKVFVDTNVLVYLFDHDAPEKAARARGLLKEHQADIVLSTQVLQEFYVTVTRKLERPLSETEAEAATRELSKLEVFAVDAEMVLRGVDRSRRHRMSLWDALILEAAVGAGCERLLSEDFQHGQKVGSLRIENPFR